MNFFTLFSQAFFFKFLSFDYYEFFLLALDVCKDKHLSLEWAHYQDFYNTKVRSESLLLLLKKHYDNIRSRKVNSAFHRGEAHAPPHSRPNEWCISQLPIMHWQTESFPCNISIAKEYLGNFKSVNRKTWLNQTSRKFLWLPGEFCIHFIHCMKTLLLHVGLNKSIAAFLCFLAASLCYISSSCSPLENALEISRETLSWIQSRF